MKELIELYLKFIGKHPVGEKLDNGDVVLTTAEAEELKARLISDGGNESALATVEAFLASPEVKKQVPATVGVDASPGAKLEAPKVVETETNGADAQSAAHSIGEVGAQVEVSKLDPSNVDIQGIDDKPEISQLDQKSIKTPGQSAKADFAGTAPKIGGGSYENGAPSGNPDGDAASIAKAVQLYRNQVQMIQRTLPTVDTQLEDNVSIINLTGATVESIPKARKYLDGRKAFHTELNDTKMRIPFIADYMTLEVKLPLSGSHVAKSPYTYGNEAKALPSDGYLQAPSDGALSTAGFKDVVYDLADLSN